MNDSVTIEINRPLPPIEVSDIQGGKVQLSSYQGEKLLIAFFRFAGCPFCSLRVHRLKGKAEKLRELGLKMVFFFESTKEQLLADEFYPKTNPIPIIADPERRWYKAFNLQKMKEAPSDEEISSVVDLAKKEGLPVYAPKGDEPSDTLPAEFLVDETGWVRKLHYAQNLNDRIRLETLFDFAEGKG